MEGVAAQGLYNANHL